MPNRYRRFEHHISFRKRLGLVWFLLTGKILTYSIREEWETDYANLLIEVDRLTITIGHPK